MTDRALDIQGVEHRYIDVGGVTLHVAVAGKGPLVVLLHGFPELWWSWRHRIPALVQAGFRVAAPDMRGYNLSDKPKDVTAYAPEKLVGDVEGLIRGLGEESAHVVGHDWGGAVAWEFAGARPGMVRRLAVLNVPHPAVMMRALLRSPVQMRKSWYMFFFQLPVLPELFVRQGDYKFLKASLAAGRLVRPSAGELAPYVDAARRADSLHGGIHYYRAAFRQLGRVRERPPVIDADTLVIWGERDRFLGRELATPPKRFVPKARVEWIPEASHWVQVDAPARVNALLAEFLQDQPREELAAVAS